MGYMRLEAEGLINDTLEWRARQKEKAAEITRQLLNSGISKKDHNKEIAAAGKDERG